MAQWIEVKVRYEKLTETGKSVKVTDPYLVDALSCTEAEARVVEEITPFCNDFNVLNVGKTKISEIFWSEGGDKFYKVKVNFITIDEKTAAEKRSASYILVQASNFAEALANFNEGMRGTLADYEIEGINETKIVDVYKYKVPEEAQNTAEEVAEKVAAERCATRCKEFPQRAARNFRNAVPDGTKVSMSVHGADGTVIPETVIVDKSKPKDDDD